MSEFQQYNLPKSEFDAFDPESAQKTALGSDKGRQVQEGGAHQSNNYKSATSGWRLTPDSAEFNVATLVQSLDIPDTTTANSMHVESDGDTYWGVNVASGFSAALASISKAGVAIFKSVSVGGSTTQYTVSDSGMFTFGDGSTGSATISADTSLTADKYYTDLTIDANKILTTANYRIFCSGTCTINGTITNKGNNGSNSSDSNGGAGGAGISAGYFIAVAAGGNGGHGDTGVGDQTSGSGGGNVSNSLGSSGAAGGTGGSDGLGGNGSAGGIAGVATGAGIPLRAGWHLTTLLDVGASGATAKYTPSAGSGGGGGGNANGGTAGGGGGGGSNGGIVAIYARNIVINTGGAITSTGGNGGNGAGGSGANAGGGGGGGAGNGGEIILVYNVLTNNGSLTVTAGTRGTGGTGSSGGGNGVNGDTGTAGTVRQFNISL